MPTPARWAIALLYMAALLSVNRLPSDTRAIRAVTDVPGGDKLGHVGAYGLMGLLVFGLCRVRGSGATLSVGAALVTVAALDEFTQPWWDRTADPWDWAADVVGLIAGWSAARLWTRFTRGGNN